MTATLLNPDKISACTDSHQLDEWLSGLDVAHAPQDVLRAFYTNSFTQVPRRVICAHAAVAQELVLNPTKDNKYWYMITTYLDLAYQDQDTGVFVNVLPYLPSDMPSYFTDKVIDLLLNASASGLALQLITALTGATYASSTGSLSIWARSSYSAANIVSRLGPLYRSYVLTDFITLVTDTHRRPPMSIDRDLTLLLVAHATPIRVGPVALAQGQYLFSDEAIELLCATPSWHHVLWYQVLNFPQIKRFAALTSPEHYPDLLHMTNKNRQIARYVMHLIPKDTTLSSYQVTCLLACITRPSDYLLARAVTQTDPNGLLRYALGQWHIGPEWTARVLPSLSDLAQFSAKLTEYAKTNPDDVWDVLLSYAEKKPARDSLAYRKELVYCVTGVYSVLMHQRGFAEFIKHRLLKTGASPEMIDDLLDKNPLATLTELAAVLAAFVRATGQDRLALSRA
jgi:hypothetical protein